MTDRMRLVPLTRKEAQRFLAQHHRHNNPPISGVFQVGLEDGGKLVGAAMACIPVARRLCDGRTLEIRRVATDGTRNANSMLYGACARAAKALGWHRLVTYTLTSESGASLRAVGWQLDADYNGSHKPNWHTQKTSGSRHADLFGDRRYPADTPKRRWWLQLH